MLKKKKKEEREKEGGKEGNYIQVNSFEGFFLELLQMGKSRKELKMAKLYR